MPAQEQILSFCSGRDMPNVKQDKTKIVQIWGEILDEGFTSVPNILLRYRSQIGLKPKHIMLIIDIMSFKWDSGSPFPSYSTLSLRAGIEERSIKRITQDLEELGLLVKTPRFDEETGAQVTTVFDFRPLVQKLIEEMNKDQEQTHLDIENEALQGRGVVNRRQQKKAVNKRQNGDDKNVMGEGDKNVTRGVTETPPGGVTELSPEENKYIKKNNIVLTLENSRTYSKGRKSVNNTTEKTKERVSKYFRESIFRNRIFELHDNLIDVKSVEDLVEEGAYRACKDVVVNRAKDFEKNGVHINPDEISKLVRKDFPYRDMPRQKTKARNFYTAAVCNMVAELISSAVAQNNTETH